MKEEFLHVVWRYRLYGVDLLSSDGKPVFVRSPGDSNQDAGPDFVNARIAIDGTEWAGQVEIHVNASDWNRHGHQNDPAYDNVILHVVYADDAPVFNSRSERLQTVSLGGRIPSAVMQRFAALQLKGKEIPCARFLSTVDRIAVNAMLERASAERMQFRTEALMLQYRLLNADPDALAYECMARAIGFRVNADAFYQLAKYLAYKQLKRVRNEPFSVLAVLLGVSGMMANGSRHEFSATLHEEWDYRRKTMQLSAMDPRVWKYARTRPLNHPHRRLVQFAAFISNCDAIFSCLALHADIHKVRDVLRDCFNIPVTWQEHGIFTEDYVMSPESLEILAINACIPLRSLAFQLGFLKADVIHDLEMLSPESNKISREWRVWGGDVANALQSQGCIQLLHRYCRSHRCLSCGIGLKLLSDANNLA